MFLLVLAFLVVRGTKARKTVVVVVVPVVDSAAENASGLIRSESLQVRNVDVQLFSWECCTTQVQQWICVS